MDITAAVLHINISTVKHWRDLTVEYLKNDFQAPRYECSHTQTYCVCETWGSPLLVGYLYIESAARNKLGFTAE